MRTVSFVIALTSLLAAPTLASPTLEVTDLGGGGFDLNVTDLNGGNIFTTAGIFGATTNQAAFQYAYDANQNLQLTGVSGVEATFVQLPCNAQHCDRNPDRRVPSIAGKYIGGTGAPTATPDRFDIAYFASPSASFGTGTIARIWLDISQTGFAAEDVYAVTGAAPAGSTLLASGVATATTDTFTDADAAQINWSIYAVPEPATLALVALAATCFVRSRR